MSERKPLPVTGQPVVRLVTGNGGSDEEPGAVALPVTEAGAVVRMSAPERARAAVAKAAGELWLHPDRLIHSAWNGRPESMADHYAYMTSREWVPEGIDGKKAAALTIAGLAYHILVAWPLKLSAKALDKAAGRPLLLLGLVIPVLVLLFIL